MNGDGLVDLFVTNFSHETNTLYVNQGGGVFVDRTEELFPGHPSFPYLSVGHPLHRPGSGRRRGPLRFQRTRLSSDRGPGRGNELPAAESSLPRTTAGVSPSSPSPRTTEAGRGSRAAASPSEISMTTGCVDALVVNIDSKASRFEEYWDASRGDRHWIGFRLVGRSVNRDGYGARVMLELGGVELVREVHASGYLSSSDLRLHFGMANSDQRGNGEGALARRKRAASRGPRGRSVLHVVQDGDSPHTNRASSDGQPNWRYDHDRVELQAKKGMFFCSYGCPACSSCPRSAWADRRSSRRSAEK